MNFMAELAGSGITGFFLIIVIIGFIEAFQDFEWRKAVKNTLGFIIFITICCVVGYPLFKLLDKLITSK